MKPRAWLVFAGIAAFGVAASAGSGAPRPPAAVSEIAYARPFVLERAYRNPAAGGSLVQTGWIVVVRADAALTAPRAVPEWVMVAGGAPVERVNHGRSGWIVGIVHGDVAIERTPIGFVDAGDGAGGGRISRDAERMGIPLLPPTRLAAAREAGGAVLNTADRDGLAPVLAELVRRYSPEEGSLANMIQGLPPEH